MAQKVEASGDGYNPQSLYNKCLDTYVGGLNYKVPTLESVQELFYLPAGVLIDIYVLLSKHKKLLDMLFEQLSDLDIFERLLRYDPGRQRLFSCLSALMESKRPLAAQLEKNFLMRYKLPKKLLKRPNKVKTWFRVIRNAYTPADDSICTDLINTSNCSNSSSINSDASTSGVVTSSTNTTTSNDSIIDTAEGDSGISDDIDELAYDTDQLTVSDLLIPFGPEIIDFGLRLGSFLSEAGWITESIGVLDCVACNLRHMKLDHKGLIVRLDCLQRLLHSESALCNFKSAEYTFDEIMSLTDSLDDDKFPAALRATIYTQFSAMYFARSEYAESHLWSAMAMRYLENNTPERIAVDVLRQAAKACLVKRDFQRANMLICQATRRAQKVFGKNHQKYADTLLDYGFFLLNVDSVYLSVTIYKEALEIKRNIFGKRNFHVAIAHEDLSYAFYVHEYSTGDFRYAREHVEKAVDIMKDLVPRDHLMLASAKRVKALLLEEIALDQLAEGNEDQALLKQSEELHKCALQLSLEVFGEVNVQTAKHYGNLGRLYQTMSRFEEAEQMHRIAIRIKTDLLGPYDYEVGLSVGHLASLYNYQMKKFREAEELYLRSIEIGLRLFGRSYSGLEYDYLGLCHVYEKLQEYEKYLKYANILENWQFLRNQNVLMNKLIYPAIHEDCSLMDVKNQFLKMDMLNLTACN